MKFYRTVTEIIGNTPLVKLNRVAEGVKPLVLAKLEFLNPGGSVKDRIAVRMIEEAERKGILRKGATIVEPTSGNTGIGLAMVAAIKGYRAVLVVPDKMSQEKEAILRAYGAEVVRAASGVDPEDPRSVYKVAERLVQEIPGAFCPNQFANPDNPAAHFETTGPEIWRDTDGRITCFVAGVGTGGTITGVARYLKMRNPSVKVMGVDPEGSVYAALFKGKEASPAPYLVEGIGGEKIPETLDFSVIDEIITVSDREAFAMARRLAREEGILVGMSSGACVAAALKVAEEMGQEDVIVVLLADTGRNYLSTLFNDDWMKEKGLL